MSVTINGTTGINTPDIESVDATFTGSVSGALPAAIDVNASAPADSLAIDSSGNVGIGTTSPSGKLHVVGNETYFQRPEDTVYLRINTANGAADLDAIGGVMRFRIDTTERMRILATGASLFGATTHSGWAPSTEGIGCKVLESNNQCISLWNSATSGTRYFAYFGVDSPFFNVGAITSNGSSTSYVTSSDYRLKENIAPMTGALAKVAQLNPVTYTWKSTGEQSQGFIAHELQEVMPDCVTGEKDAVETYVDDEGVEQTRPVYQGIDTSFLVATLTAAIQELKAELDAAKDRIAALEGANNVSA